MATFNKHRLTLQTLCLTFAAIFMAACTTAVGQQSNNAATTDTQKFDVDREELVAGLNHPWGMAFLPDGRLLITERDGQLRVMSSDNELSDPVEGVPEVFNEGQGGLLDVALDPEFASNQYVYLSFSEPGEENKPTTALGRGRFDNNRLSDFEVIFRQHERVEGKNHFGGRIVFSPEGNIFLTLSDRFKFDPAQDNRNHLGTIVHLNRDGSAAEGNPFAGNKNGRAEIWSYGHRNIEAAAFDPATDKLWVAEMGPKGGDELNLIEPGKNYGWPVVSWGEHYDGKDIPDPSTRPEFADATIHWTPVISPSGMVFYQGDLFSEFKGNMLIGGLTAKGIVCVEINGEDAKEVGRIDLGERIREVEQAPDGSIYALTDKSNGAVLRLTPKERAQVRQR